MTKFQKISDIEMEENHPEYEPENFFIDILLGKKETASPKKILIQQVLRQIIDTYGFDRADLEINYKPMVKSQKGRYIDITIFQHGSPHNDENLQRIIICKNQKNSEKLRNGRYKI
jgi:type I restriction enzyme M protein